MIGGFLGSDDDLDDVASELDTEPDIEKIEDRVRTLNEAADRLVSAAELSIHVDDPPAKDADGVTKVEALDDAIYRNELVIEPPTAPTRPPSSPSVGRRPTDDRDANSGEATELAKAADDLSTRRAPDSELGRQLLDAVAGRSKVGQSPIETLESVLDALDRDETVRERIHRTDGVADVDEIVDAYEETNREVRELRERREQAADATEALLGELDLPVTEDEPIARAVERARLEVSGDGDPDLSEAVETARSVVGANNPIKPVFEALDGTGDLAGALVETASMLEEMDANRALTSDDDRDRVAELAETVADRASESDGAAGAAIAERASELREIVERANDSNTVTPYAARRELRFYDRTLVPAVREPTTEPANDTPTEADQQLSELADRRQRIEERYVSGRPDHNHRIPLFFLSLVDDLIEDAEGRLARGHTNEVVGLCAGIEAVLDRTEQLYTFKEYSVMLRSLRG